MYATVIFLFLSLLVCPNNGFNSGAPPDACDDMQPQHGNSQPELCGANCSFNVFLTAIGGQSVTGNVGYRCGLVHTCELT